MPKITVKIGEPPEQLEPLPAVENEAIAIATLLHVQEALERAMENRTVFIIAHRLSTVRRADTILVLEKGRIVESGSHSQLLAQDGRYTRFYARQFQE